MLPSLRRPLCIVGGSAILAAAVAAPRRASAGTECIFRVIPEHPSAAWEGAINRSREKLASRSGDCGKIVVEVENDFATVTFTTIDGRRTVRVLQDPTELSPTLDALVVTLPAPRSSVAEYPARETPGTPAPVTSPPPAPIHALLGAQAGARFAGPGPLIGPSAILGAGLGIADWEIGLVAQWTPVYGVLTDDPTRPARLAGISAGLAVGHRARLTKELALATGLSLAGAAQHEGWRVADATGKTLHQESDRGQALVGAYAALLFPSNARVRFRSTLSADVDATHIGENDPPATGVPPLPWWALTFAIGIESEVL